MCFRVSYRGDRAGITDARSYLPAERTDDRERRIGAGIPDDKTVSETISELGSDMIPGARREGIRFGWVGGDGFYGNDPKPRYGPDDAGGFHMPDIHSARYVRMTDPCPSVPEKKPGKGRPPSRYRSDIRGIRAESLVRGRDESERREYRSGRGTKGEKRRKVIVTDVRTRNGEDRRQGRRN